jgi:site-specific DNA recombinase
VRALGVARVSTAEQADNDRYSIPHQRDRISEYCARHGWELVTVFEYVKSGGSNYRELQEILDAVVRERIDVVVVNELDRLARNMTSTLLFLEDLQKAGARFVAIADDLDLTKPDGELKMMILGVFAQYFRRQLSRKIRGGLLQRARSGKHHGGPMPYGYRWNNGGPEPDPREAPVVRQIYGWYVRDGWGSRKIAQHLNAQGIPTKHGQTIWASTEVRRLLANPVYVGDLRHGAVDYVQDRTGTRHKVAGTDILWVQGALPPLVDRTLWDAAQEVRRRRGARSGRRSDSPYLLSGLVYCALCARPMVPVKRRQRVRYLCRGYHSAGVCHPHHVDVDDLELAVADALAEQVAAPPDATLAKWVETFERERRGPDPVRRLRRLERDLAALSERLQRAEDAFLRGVFTADQLTAARERLLAERRKLEDEIEECARAADRQPLDAVIAALTTELSRPATAIRCAGSVAERRELISRYVQRIEVGPEQHVVMHWAEDRERPPG